MSRLGTVRRATSELDALSGIVDFEVICASEISDEDHLYLGDVKGDALYADPSAGFDAKRGSDGLDVVRLGDLLARADGGTDPGDVWSGRCSRIR